MANEQIARLKQATTARPCPSGGAPVTAAKYWIGSIGPLDDFGDAITDKFIDGKTAFGPWAIMSEASWAEYGGTLGRLGVGFGQEYTKQEDGRWLKTAG